MYKRDLELERKWSWLITELDQRLGKKPKDLNSVLFLIGVQELGKGSGRFSKEEKQDLMHIAVCTLLEDGGYYEFVGRDQDGWPHWKERKTFEIQGINNQEQLLKERIVVYFRNMDQITQN